MSDKAAKEQALIDYRNAWKNGSVIDAFYSDDVNFYAPMKVFNGKKDVLSALQNWFGLLKNVTDCSYIIGETHGAVISKASANNTGDNDYSFWEYDYFEFNEKNQIKLYKPIFDSGAATHYLLGFDIASRCALARKKSDKIEDYSDDSDKNFDIFSLIRNQQLQHMLAENCSLQWPFFNWNGKKDVMSVLNQLLHNLEKIELIFGGSNSHEFTCLYKLTQSKNPPLWCGFWITTSENKIQNIRLVFDSY